MNLLIVESPNKIQKIQKILGSGFVVGASVGHIRDMPSKSISIDIPGGFVPTYVISKDKAGVVKKLSRLASQADKVYLAMDGDREGEAIAWHLIKTLKLPLNSPRVKFNEITQKEILKVMGSEVVTLDMNMVDAQQARRMVDRIVGYEVSPVLWRKIQGAKSAGRVQSPVTRIIVDRENEINNFETSSAYKLSAFGDKDEQEFKALFELMPQEKQDAVNVLNTLNGQPLIVQNIKTNPVIKKPPIPFTTSTFQQAISSELGLIPKEAMKIAQNLFADGLITYMRTDSPALAPEAIDEARLLISNEFGDRYSEPRQFKSKDANAQEAHEAIRPTALATAKIDGSDARQKVYGIIRNRVLASQMSDAQLAKTIVEFKALEYTAYTKGSVLTFDGFMRVLGASKDDILPAFSIGENIIPKKLTAKQSYKKSKSRYTQASLVKKLEALGIGRPSTFATMVDVVIQRGYVVTGNAGGLKVDCVILTLENGEIFESNKQDSVGADKNKLLPTESAYALMDFMHEHFPDIIDYDFTSNLEKHFDDISSGAIKLTDYMGEFYDGFHPGVEKVLAQVADIEQPGVNTIGVCPNTGADITIGTGRYGHYIKLNTEKPKFTNIPKHIDYKNIGMESALSLLALPRTLGQFNKNDIVVAYGKNGGYLKCNDVFINLKDGEPESVSLEEALALYQARENQLANAPVCEDSSCGLPLVVKPGKWGDWYACTGYPKCKHKQVLKPPQ